MDKSETPITKIAATLNKERLRAGLSIAEVARRANIAKSTLSQLENAIGNPSIETLWSICLVLDIPVSRLLESPKQETKVIRRGDGVTVASNDQSYQATLLSACPPNVSRDIYWIEASLNKPHHSKPHNDGVIEHIIVTKGKAKIGVALESYELNEGDYICYAGDLAHVFEALEGNACAMLISEYRM